MGKAANEPSEITHLHFIFPVLGGCGHFRVRVMPSGPLSPSHTPGDIWSPGWCLWASWFPQTPQHWVVSLPVLACPCHPTPPNSGNSPRHAQLLPSSTCPTCPMPARELGPPRPWEVGRLPRTGLAPSVPLGLAGRLPLDEPHTPTSPATSGSGGGRDCDHGLILITYCPKSALNTKVKDVPH